MLPLALISPHSVAAPPVDQDGEYVHIATVPVHSLRAPLNIHLANEGLGAWADDREGGGLWLEESSGVLMHLSARGELEREAFRHVALPSYQLSGRFDVAGDKLTWVSTSAGPQEVDLVSGAIRGALAPIPDTSTYEVFRGREALWVFGNERGFRWTGAAWSPASALDRGSRLPADPATRPTPCGALPDGTPLWVGEEGARDAQLAALTDDLTVDRVLWSHPTERDAIHRATACQRVGTRTHLSTIEQLWVFDGSELVSSIGGAPGGAPGPYTPEILLTSALLGDGDVLAAVERRSPAIRLYGRRWTGSAPGADPLDRLRAGATGAARLEAMWALGWWEALEAEAKSQGDVAWQLRARARQLVYWARSGPAGEVFAGVGQVIQYDREYLPEVEAALATSPREPWLLYARALLLGRLGRAAEQVAALEALEGVLPSPELPEVPELEILAQARADAAAEQAAAETARLRRLAGAGAGAVLVGVVGVWVAGGVRRARAARPTPLRPDEAADVFLSYRREDRAKVEELSRLLRARGLSVWYDAKLTSGSAYDAEIERQLRAARCVVVCWSPAAVASDWVRAEATIGRQRNVLAPVLLEACELPAPFNLIHANNLIGGVAADKPEFRAFLDRIGTLVGRRVTDPDT